MINDATTLRSRLPLPPLDPVLLATLMTALLLAALTPPETAARMARFTVDNLIGIAPFLLLSAVAGAWLSASHADRAIGRVFRGHLALAITMASAFGALSPFCSCGVIPLIATLLGAGVPLPAVMAFWISSPVMDPEMFLLTAGGLGLPFALAKTATAIGMGLFGGVATHLALRLGAFRQPLKAAPSGCGGYGGCGATALADESPRWAFWHDPARREQFRERFVWTIAFLGKWLLLAYVVESVMVEYLPAGQIAGWLGGDRFWAVPLSVLAGIPAYLNGYAAIPLVAGLMESGMGQGPALAFVTAGAVTSVPAAMAVFALVRGPLFAWYLLLGGSGALIAGLLYGAA